MPVWLEKDFPTHYDALFAVKVLFALYCRLEKNSKQVEDQKMEPQIDKMKQIQLAFMLFSQCVAHYNKLTMKRPRKNGTTITAMLVSTQMT
uniref:Ras-GEF domain-containing protein n=1 Tax=Panagrellus redivivus TaxID=6233 RepID=A0A7E4VEF6_PANRE